MPLSGLLRNSDFELKAELQLILNAVVEGLCGMDAAGNATFCNDAFLRMTGYRAEEVVGKKLHELVHHSRPDGTKYPAEECPFRKAIDLHEPVHATGEFLWRKDGSCFPAEYWAHPLQRPSSSTVGVATVQDVTETLRAKNVLHESEEKFRRILANVPDVIWTSDQHGKAVYISPNVEAVFGYTQQEMYAGGANLWLGRIHPEDFGRVKQAYKDLFENQSACDEEFRIRRKDGSWIWVHNRALRTHQENGVLRADGILSDITRRRQAEAELQSKTAFLEAQANSTIDGILVVDGRGQRLLLNQRLVELFRIPPKIVADKDDRYLLEYVTARVKDSESFVAKIEHLNRNPSETSRDEIEFKDGMVFDRYSSPVLDQNGIYYGRIWTFRDITEHKRNEDQLQQLSIAVEQSAASIVITDPHARISYVNRKFTEITGYSQTEAIGKNPRILKSGLTPGALYLDLWSKIKHGREWRGEFCNKKKNGELYWEAASITPITNPKGVITHFLAVKDDITERKQAEEALRASEKRYRLLFDRNLAGVLRTTLDGRILDCNQAAARTFGYDSPEEVLSLRAADLYHSTFDREAFLTKLKVEKSITNCEMRCRRKNGDSVWIIANFSMIEDDSALGAIVEGTVVDITERKRAEEELYSSRQMLQSILDALPQRVFWKDRNCIYLGCNQAFATDGGLDDAAQIVGKSDFDLAWSGSAELYRADDKLVMEQGKAKLNFEERQTRPDGSVLWLQTNKLPLRDRQGRVTGVIATYENITERKRAETELRLTQFSLASASDAVFWIDPQARFVYVNQAACRSLGHSREDLLTLSIPDISPVFSIERWGGFWEKLKVQGSVTLESQHQAKEGQPFPVEVTANFLEYDGREYAFAFARDITERLALESQLRQAQKLEGIGQLAAGIAHEINTPVQFVTDNLKFLRDSLKATYELMDLYRGTIRNTTATLPPDVAATLEQAEQNCDLDYLVSEVPVAIDQGLDGARRVAEIVRAMKQFSHPDSTGKTASDLNQAIESTITVARSEWKYVAEIATEFDASLPLVVCYAGDINQVILNLLVNAAHAIKEKVKDGEMGRITVRTCTRGEFVEISVADTGGGIPEAIRTRVFDPFFTTKEVGKGTGQGLTLAHTVVTKKHSGKIWFETEMGRGTTFFIDLPIDPTNLQPEN